MIKGWLCNNCGHIHEATEQLTELGFQWYDEHTSRTRCENCGAYTLQRVTTYDNQGYPIAGYFLIVLPKNKIKKGK